MKEIDFINDRISGKKVEVPSLLYKYRPYDKYTFDMLERGYVYLCPAENLDDPSECKTEITVKDFYDLQNDGLKFKAIDLILEYVKPYTPDENFDKAKAIISRCVTLNGYVRRNILLDLSFELQEIMPDVNVAPLVNYLGNIPEKLNDEQLKNKIKEYVFPADDARKYFGICSLCSLKDNAEMWKNYADDYKGYCIEFSTSGYVNNEALYPVIYCDNRETNIVKNIMATLVAEMISGISNGQTNPDKSYYARIFLTKDTVWSYQKEWRLLGNAGENLPAPTIKKIYLGKNMLQENKDKMIDYCSTHNIAVE